MLEALAIIAVVVAVQLWQARGLPEGPAPALAGTGIDGKPLDLAEIVAAANGKPVLVAFWATWCPVCKAEDGNLAVDRARPSGAVRRHAVGERSREHLQERELTLRRPSTTPTPRSPAPGTCAACPATSSSTAHGNVRFRVVGYATDLGPARAPVVGGTVSAVNLPPARLAWTIWGLGSLVYLAAFFQRVAPAVMTDQLMAEFALGGAALGNLSAFYFYAYVAMQIPTGLLADRWGPRKLLAAGTAIAAARRRAVRARAELRTGRARAGCWSAPRSASASSPCSSCRRTGSRRTASRWSRACC